MAKQNAGRGRPDAARFRAHARREIPPEMAVLMSELGTLLNSNEVAWPEPGGGDRRGSGSTRLLALAETLPGRNDLKRFAALDHRTLQWYRELRHASEIFGRDLKRWLVKYGATRPMYVARLQPREAKEIMKRGTIALQPGRKRPLGEVTVRELHEFIRRQSPKRVPGKGRVQRPGQLFSLPDDLLAVRKLLVTRLKSLRRGQPGGVPRMRVAPADEVARQDLERLTKVLDLYGALVDEALAEVAVDRGKSSRKKVGLTSVPAQLVRAPSKGVLQRLRGLAAELR